MKRPNFYENLELLIIEHMYVDSGYCRTLGDVEFRSITNKPVTLLGGQGRGGITKQISCS